MWLTHRIVAESAPLRDTKLQNIEEKQITPWRKAFVKIGLSQAELSRAMRCHRSKISRALKDETGLINGCDQQDLITVAKMLHVDLRPEDITPDIG
jgi:hypothetical protein